MSAAVLSGPARAEAVAVLANMTAAAMSGEAKITRFHRERLALVYLRQSSMAQVRQHTASTMRQYALAEEAARLGWAPGDVKVIDTDLGVSGRWGVVREGFAELVSLVCRGEAGAIFGIEISRLAHHVVAREATGRPVDCRAMVWFHCCT